jgi:5-hydroxyisourate hydrolase
MQDHISQRRGFLAAGIALGGAAIVPSVATSADIPKAGSPAALTAAPTSQAGASPRLTFHAVDIFSGATGAGLGIELSRFEDGAFKLIKTVDAVVGGRTAEPLLLGEAYVPGRYEVLVNVGDYFARLGTKLPQPAFLSKVPLRIVIHNASQRVHLPVLFSPWGYSFYRGS